MDEEKQERIDFEGSLSSNLQSLERGGKRVIEQFSDFRSEQENQVLTKMQQQIEMLDKEVAKSISEKQQSHSYILQYLEQDIPSLKMEIQQEQNNRNDIEGKVQEQF